MLKFLQEKLESPKPLWASLAFDMVIVISLPLLLNETVPEFGAVLST